MSDVDNSSESSSQMEEIKQLIRQGRKMDAIKKLREETGQGLKESKEMVEAIQAKLVDLGEIEPSKSGCAGAVLFFLLTSAVIGYQMFA